MRGARDFVMIQTIQSVCLFITQSQRPMKTKETLLEDLLVKDRLHELEMAYCRGVVRDWVTKRLVDSKLFEGHFAMTMSPTDAQDALRYASKEAVVA